MEAAERVWADLEEEGDTVADLHELFDRSKRRLTAWALGMEEADLAEERYEEAAAKSNLHGIGWVSAVFPGECSLETLRCLFPILQG